MIKSYKTKDVFEVSIGGIWPEDAMPVYSLEGRVLVHLLVRWDDEQEKWEASIIEWVEMEPFVVKFEGSKVPELMAAEELPYDVAGEVEWIIERCIN